MNAWQRQAIRSAFVLVAACACVASLASEPAGDLPAFEAPTEPPAEGTASAMPTAPEPTGALSLHDALALALMQSPELQAFSWEVRASEVRAIQAGKAPDPELDIRFWNLARESRVAEQEQFRLILTQTLELGGKQTRRADLAQADSKLAEWDYEAKRLEVTTRVTSLFVSVLGAQRRVEASGRLVAFFEQMRGTVEQLVESGSVPKVEIHRITRRLGFARIEARRAEFELAAARLQLASNWDSRSPQFTEAVGRLDLQASVPDIDTVMDMATDGPTVGRWEAEVARGEAALSLAKANRKIDLDYGVGLRWQDDGLGPDWLVDFEIPLPMFNSRKGDVVAAQHELARQEADRRAARATANQMIAEAYYAVAEGEVTTRAMRDEILPAARATFEAYRTGFDMRVDALGDLLDARRDLARAELLYTDALVAYRQALANLEGVVGQAFAPTD